MSSAPDAISGILRRQRSLIVISLVALTGFSWLYLVARAPRGASMPTMGGMGTPSLAASVVMWGLMMVAMMLPSAAPMVLLYSRVRGTRSQAAPVAGTWVFLAGYLSIWFAFSIVAAFAQKLLTGPSMELDSHPAKWLLVIAAGLYQLVPLKAACVRHCRSPAEFLSRHWRPGALRALELGIRHGLYCLGCCWMLMTLLFVVGIMNLLWVVGLTILVACEKLLPRGALLGRLFGVALVLWGAAALLSN